MAFPKFVRPFLPSNGGNAEFQNVGQTNELLRLTWTYPLGVFGAKNFAVGTECFLESATDLNDVPEEHLLSSISMAAILAGEVLPGTQEFLDAILGQDTKNFQTIVGEVKLKVLSGGAPNPAPVDDLNIGPQGTVFDVTFQRTALLGNTRVVRFDAWSLCQYSNRVDSVDHMVYIVPGAVHKAFNLKKSQLGAVDSANRTSVIDWIQNQAFWV